MNASLSYAITPTKTICVNDVAAHIGKSRSYVAKKFKDDLGINVGAFISRCKLEEAKSLLAYTAKPLSEISSLLCFSSQSYFRTYSKTIWCHSPAVSEATPYLTMWSGFSPDGLAGHRPIYSSLSFAIFSLISLRILLSMG